MNKRNDDDEEEEDDDDDVEDFRIPIKPATIPSTTAAEKDTTDGEDEDEDIDEEPQREDKYEEGLFLGSKSSW
jgi:hypothetical protein